MSNNHRGMALCFFCVLSMNLLYDWAMDNSFGGPYLELPRLRCLEGSDTCNTNTLGEGDELWSSLLGE